MPKYWVGICAWAGSVFTAVDKITTQKKSTRRTTEESLLRHRHCCMISLPDRPPPWNRLEYLTTDNGDGQFLVVASQLPPKAPEFGNSAWLGIKCPWTLFWNTCCDERT